MEYIPLVLICIVIPVGVAVASYIISNRIARRNALLLQTAWNAYLQSLAQISRTPVDPRARNDALARGREFMALSWQIHKSPGIDEMMIQNDILAASAGAARII